MKFRVIVILFLLFGAFFIISNGNLHLSDKKEAMQFGRVYYSWFGSLFSSVKNTVGYAVKSEWLPPANLTAKG